MQDYISYFFIYAIVGWIMEVSFHVITKGKFINRGFLSGPYCPIYGFGAVSVILLLNQVGPISKLMLFFVSMIIATVLELVTGFILEKIFHKRWWDYTSYKFNIGGYVCAEFSLLWGAVCFILYEAIHPLIVKLVGLVPMRAVVIVNIIMGVMFVVDFVTTIITIMGLTQKFRALERQSRDIRRVSDELGQVVAKSTFEALDRKKEFENSKFIKGFDERSAEFKAKFDSLGEKRLLRSYPNLIKDLDDKWENREYLKRKESKIEEH